MRIYYFYNNKELKDHFYFEIANQKINKNKTSKYLMHEIIGKNALSTEAKGPGHMIFLRSSVTIKSSIPHPVPPLFR